MGIAMATRAVLTTFEKYQKERVAFVTQVAEMAKNPQVSTVGTLHAHDLLIRASVKQRCMQPAEH